MLPTGPGSAFGSWVRSSSGLRGRRRGVRRPHVSDRCAHEVPPRKRPLEPVSPCVPTYVGPAFHHKEQMELPKPNQTVEPTADRSRFVRGRRHDSVLRGSPGAFGDSSSGGIGIRFSVRSYCPAHFLCRNLGLRPGTYSHRIIYRTARWCFLHRGRDCWRHLSKRYVAEFGAGFCFMLS